MDKSKFESFFRENKEKYSCALEKTLESQILQIFNLFQDMLNCLKKNGVIYICGNGGSFSDAQHISGELVVKFKKERVPFKSIALGSNPNVVTATSNDFNYDYVFSRELLAYGNSNNDDILICLSTSGNSQNIKKVLDTARELNINSWLITGQKRSNTTDKAEKYLYINSEDTALIQEITMHIMHQICYQLEESN